MCRHRTIDKSIVLHIIGPTIKGCDGDEYALNDGLESRRKVKILPETTAPNGPPSLEAKAPASIRDELLPLQSWDIPASGWRIQNE